MPKPMGASYTDIVQAVNGLTQKQKAEFCFWDNEVTNYVLWYQGILPCLYQTACPDTEQRIVGTDIRQSAILTWTELHQKAKYLKDLSLSADAFKGMKVLDIGAGPIPSATCFEGCRLYALDPLNSIYEMLGFPRQPYPDVRFIGSPAENIPFDDDFFDAVISVNAIDHVDDFERTASEIQRVLRKGGKFAMHVHYHPETECEPIELNDERFLTAFRNIDGLRPVRRSRQSFSNTLGEDESFVLWKN